MATAEVPDTTPSIFSLPPEERRKILLVSLRKGLPCSPKISRQVSTKVSRYVSHFTSGRWREKIWSSDDNNEDRQREMSSPESDAPRPLTICGFDLHCDDYLKEREMINKWHIIERELHFPNLEKEYIQKWDAKNQSDVGDPESCQAPTVQDVDIGQEPTTEDIVMEECQESPQKTIENIKTSTKSSIGVEELGSKVEKLHEGIEVSAEQKKSLVPDLESSIPLEGKEPEEKMTAVPEDSKVVADSGTEMKTPEAICPAETSLDTASDPNSETSGISRASKDVKEVSTVHDSKLAENSKMETSTESGDKMDATTVSEDSKVETSEPNATESSSVKVSMRNSESQGVPEVKKPADKMDDETVSERSEVSGVDLETSGATLLGKRKADSMSEEDPDEKKTKK